MLLFVLSMLFPTDSLDLIYDNFYKNQKTTISIITDKDYYFPGEDVMYLANLNHSGNKDTHPPKLGKAVLFDENKNILDKALILIEDTRAFNSLKIPDTLATSKIYLGISTTVTGFYVKKMILVNAENKTEMKPEVKILTKNKFLIPEQINSIKIGSSNYSNQKLQLKTTKNELIQETILDQFRTIEFVPTAGEAYVIEIGNEKFDLPKTKKSATIDAKLQADQLKIEIKNVVPNSSDKILLVAAGKELLWLSKLYDKQSTFDLPVNEANSQYLSCFILNNSLEVLDKVFVRKEQQSKIMVNDIVNDSLRLFLPKEHLGTPFLSDVVYSEWKDQSLKFDIKEIEELSQFGKVSNLIRFRNRNEKINWLNYNFEIDLSTLLIGSEQVSSPDIDEIIYNLPVDVKIDDKLEINALDLQGRIIDYVLKKRQVLINIEQFQSPNSSLLINATYKNKDVFLTKDTLLEHSRFANLVKEYFLNPKNSSHYLIEKNTGFEALGPLKNSAIVLDEIVVADSKNKVSYSGPGRGKSLGKDALRIDEYTSSALDILPQIGVFNYPHSITGHITSNKRMFVTQHQAYTNYYPIFLVIRDAGVSYYRGYDFHRLEEFDAKWIKSITKINEQPEAIIVNVTRAFDDKNSNVLHEQIFSQPNYNENIGVVTWKYHKTGYETEIVKIPLDLNKKDLNWSIHFFDQNGSSTSYGGIVDVSAYSE